MFDRSPTLVVKQHDEEPITLETRGSGTYALGAIEVALVIEDSEVGWELHAASDVALDKVGLSWTSPAGKKVRIFSNGYQSWSRAGLQVLGEDRDPSLHTNSIELVRAFHHADVSVAEDGALRSELVTAWDGDDGSGLRCLGFDGGTEHDGTFRFTRLDESEVRVQAEAHFGGATLRAGETRKLHSVIGSRGPNLSELLEGWAARAGSASHARVSAPYQIGWCSWYQYFGEVTEEIVEHNLTLASDFPFSVFQVDDGFQHQIGDWLITNDKFRSGVEVLASRIALRGMSPGIWIAPFLASPESNLAKDHPEHLAMYKEDKPLIATVNPGWGGAVYALDTTKPETLLHLEEVARSLVEIGFTYLKLDFLFACSVPGKYADPSKTRTQRVRAGLDAIRRGAGEETFLLGCGCPLGPAIGVVDGMRIGPDVAPFWELEEGSFFPPGYAEEAPATINAWRNTLSRSFMHRRLWLNDPDCLMLRRSETNLTEQQVEAWADAVAVSGGMAIVSDDLAHLNEAEKKKLTEVIEIGRRSDRRAVDSNPARCQDLLDRRIPRSLSSETDTLNSWPT